MSTTLTNPKVTLAVLATLNSGAAPAPAGAQINQSPAFAIAAGSAVAQVDRSYSAPFTVASGTPLVINLITALDPLGTAAGMAHLSVLLVENDGTASAGILTVGAGTHSAIGSDQFTVQPNGGVGFLCNPNPGYAVVGSSSDNITITCASGTITGKISALGRSI